MDKLRHIHSKVGTESSFWIPIFVEGAIAEAVEAYDSLRNDRDSLQLNSGQIVCELHTDLETMQKERDQLAARVERLEEVIKQHFMIHDGMCDVYRYAMDGKTKCDCSHRFAKAALNESPAVSLLLHDADLLENLASDWANPNDRYREALCEDLAELVAELRKQAAALEGEGDD